MAEIPNITSKQPMSTINNADAFSKGFGLSSKATQTVKQVVSLLGSRNVGFNSLHRPDNTETGKATGSTGIPALDNPDDIKQLEANLEKLISYLQMDNDERQTHMAKNRIEIQKDTLENERKNRSEKISKSLKDMDEAERSRKASKIFGWLMTAIAVIAAVVACVATGGLAVGPVIGAAIAIGAQILNETGVMEKITNKLAKALEDAGMSKQASQILAQVLVTVAIMAASLGAGFLGGGGTALANAVRGAAETLDKVRAAIAIAAIVVGIASTVSGGVGAYDSYKAGMSQSEVTDTEKYIAALKQRLEESEEELEQLIQQIQNSISMVAEMLTSATDTSDEIARNLGNMA